MVNGQYNQWFMGVVVAVVWSKSILEKYSLGNTQHHLDNICKIVCAVKFNYFIVLSISFSPIYLARAQ